MNLHAVVGVPFIGGFEPLRKLTVTLASSDALISGSRLVAYLESDSEYAKTLPARFAVYARLPVAGDAGVVRISNVIDVSSGTVFT